MEVCNKVNTSADKVPANSRLRFTLSELLLFTSFLAVPMAMFSWYWSIVNNTVDQRTVPLVNANIFAQGLLFTSLLLFIVAVIAFLATLLKRQLRLPAFVFATGMLVAVCLMFPRFYSRIVSPMQGNALAAMHNDAAAIAATAVERFYTRTKQWPKSWEDIDIEITGIIAEVNTLNPPTRPGPTSATPESQSIFLRAPDLSELTADEIHEMVVIDFSADPQKLGTMKPPDFHGIIPRKPSYNYYLFEIERLIARLSGSVNTPTRP